MSNLEIKQPGLSIDEVVFSEIMRSMTRSNSRIEYWGAVGTVPSFTDGMTAPSIFSLENRSNIVWKFLLLCSIIYIGEILRFFGIFFLISSKGNILACLCLVFLFSSLYKDCNTTSFIVELCELLLVATIIWSSVQSDPQSSGYPTIF